jgi:prophage regulatory protein
MKDDRIVRLPEVLQMTGVCSTTIWRLEKKDKFPKRIHIGRAVGWRLSDLQAWIATRAEAA